ncbi:MAG TPA: hypothetical protein VN281_20475, partial [Verrucomicrobiae bacterium]|nr:hypothetical protein [Verrucomicrobiae bacterium]
MKCNSYAKIASTFAFVALLLGVPASGLAATITWTNAAGGGWNTAANWSPNQVPGTNDTAVIQVAGISNAAVTVTLNSATTVGGITLGASGGGCGGGQVLSLAGQTLSLYGPLVIDACGHFAVDSGTLFGATNIASVNGSFNWTAGFLAGTLTFATNSTLTINGPGNNDFPNCTLTNYGIVTWTNGLLRGGQSGTAIYNYGLWDIQGDLSFSSAYGGAVSFFNFGTLRKSAGTNTTQFSAAGLSSTGNVDVQTGVLYLPNGATFSGGTVTNLGG